MKIYAKSFAGIIALVTLASCVTTTHVVPTGGVLRDTILISSAGGAAPREAKRLGDIDLTSDSRRFTVTLDSTSTHWWIIGHRDGKVVYSSNSDLSGVDMYSVEPYDVATPLDWNIPANLQGFVSGGGFSADWWAATVVNHTSHVTPDGNSATLWTFGPSGSDIGTITVDLHD